MASIQRIVSPLTKDVSYRVQVRVKGRAAESQTFPNLKEAKAWAASIETAIREGRHFPHAAARRTNFDAMAKDYVETVLADFDEKEKATRVRQLKWWSGQFAGLTLAEITADRISKARDKLSAEAFTRGKPHKDNETGEMVAPKAYKRTGATTNRYIATLSHLCSFAVKERRLLDRNPVSDISRKKEPRGRTRFLSDEERAALLDACAKSEWGGLHALVLLAITTGARKGELIGLRWVDVDLKKGLALVRETKNDDQRTLPLAGKALEALRELEAPKLRAQCIRFPADDGGTRPEDRRAATGRSVSAFRWALVRGTRSGRHQGFSFSRSEAHHGIDVGCSGMLVTGNRGRTRAQDPGDGEALQPPGRRSQGKGDREDDCGQGTVMTAQLSAHTKRLARAKRRAALRKTNYSTGATARDRCYQHAARRSSTEAVE